MGDEAARAEAAAEAFADVALGCGVSDAVLAFSAAGRCRSTAVPGSVVDLDVPVPAASLTKVFTATAVMRLVDSRVVDLDRPVEEYVPEFRLRDRGAARLVTVRRLLAHTSGLQTGDLERTPGGPPPADESLADYVARSARLELTLPPGEIYSYSATGYSVLGRLVEVVHGAAWPQALEELVLQPLELRSTVWHPVALADRLQAAAASGAPQYRAPSDQIWTSVRDLLALAELHAVERRPALRALLGDESVAEMREAQVALPNPAVGVAGALGWRIFAPDGGLVGHWGLSETHLSALWLQPFSGFAVAVAGTHDDPERATWLLLDVGARVFGAGLTRPPEAGAGDWIAAVSAVGTYELPSIRFVVEGTDGSLSLRCEQRLDERPTPYLALTQGQFAVQPTESVGVALASAPGQPRVLLCFLGHDGSVYRYLHVRGQTAVRVGAAALSR